MAPVKYPRISIRGKNELAKSIRDQHFLFQDAANLIGDVKANFDKYWKDNLKHSKPNDEKWVRSAYGTPLGSLLNKINSRVLAPHDGLIPQFIFGGVEGRSHIQAAQHLQGDKSRRTYLKLDLSRFFEQITEQRVISLLINKCRCTYPGAKLIASLCCLPLGEKGHGQSQRAIARGFATSSRLATWCSLDLCMKIDRLIKQRLRGRDPKLSIYVDDIAISATKTKKAELLTLSQDIKQLCQNHQRPLILNDKKMKIIRHNEGVEHLGLKLNRRSLSLGKKSFAKKMRLKTRLPELSGIEKANAKRSLRGISQYERQVKTTELLPQKKSLKP